MRRILAYIYIIIVVCLFTVVVHVVVVVVVVVVVFVAVMVFVVVFVAVMVFVVALVVVVSFLGVLLVASRLISDSPRFLVRPAVVEDGKYIQEFFFFLYRRNDFGFRSSHAIGLGFN